MSFLFKIWCLLYIKQGINEKILSLNFKDYTAEIKTADAQKSYKDGVTVLVTGSLMGKDNLKRKFAQSFFLAPQDNGYFVLNDTFRFVEDNEPSENHTVNGIDSTPAVPQIPDSGIVWQSKMCDFRLVVVLVYFFHKYLKHLICCQSLLVFLIPLHQTRHS